MKKKLLGFIFVLALLISLFSIVFSGCATKAQYKVEVYLQNIQNEEFTLDTTYSYTAKGIVDGSAIVNPQEIEGFTFSANNSILQGMVTADGKLTLKVYYTRNSYSVSPSETSAGSISKDGPFKYGETITVTAIPNNAYDFVGWYKGEELISTNISATFAITGNIIAKFAQKQYSQLLNIVLTGSYYTNAITAAAGISNVANHNKYKAIPYKYLETKGYDVTKIKNNQLRCESDVFIYNNELYIALKTEVEASTNYFDCQILKYQITPEEIADLNKMYSTANSAASSYKTTYFQAPFMIQHLSYLKTPIELLSTPAKITPEASDVCNTNIAGNGSLFGYKTNSIHIGDEKVADNYCRYTFMIYKNCDNSLTPVQTSKMGVITYWADTSLSSMINNSYVYSNKNWDISYNLRNKDKIAFEESIVDVQIYNSLNATLYDYTIKINTLNKQKNAGLSQHFFVYLSCFLAILKAKKKKREKEKMKRFCAFIGVICLMLCGIATRLYFNRLSTFLSGEYTAFNSDDLPFSPAISKGYERVDLDSSSVQEVISALKCKIIKTEHVEDITIYYCYSPFLLKSVYLFNNDINVMIAQTSNKIVVGTPLIKGSF